MSTPAKVAVGAGVVMNCADASKPAQGAVTKAAGAEAGLAQSAVDVATVQE